MPTKQEAQAKVTAAEEACTKIQAAWYVAHKALAGAVGTNGYGVYRDRFELRDKLELARQNIETALETIDRIDWPTTADYDLL